MITQSRVVVGTTAVLVVSAGISPKRVTLKRMQNNAAVFLGNASVTTSTGLPYEGSEYISLELEIGESLYAIADANLNDEIAVLSGVQLL